MEGTVDSFLTPRENLALDLVFELLGESRFNRRMDEYRTIAARAPKLERLQEFRKSKDQYDDAWDTQNWILREIEAALVAQCVQRDRLISRKRSHHEAKQLLEALRYIFYIIDDAERCICESPALLRHVELEELADERRKRVKA
jgi:hypothetical protein